MQQEEREKVDKDGSKTAGGKMEVEREQEWKGKGSLLDNLSPSLDLYLEKKKERSRNDSSQWGERQQHLSKGTEAARRTPEERTGHRDAELITMCS